MGEFDTSTRKLRSSATGEMDFNPLDKNTNNTPVKPVLPKLGDPGKKQNGDTSAPKGLPSLPKRAQKGVRYDRGIDSEFIQGVDETDKIFLNNLSASGQTWWNKFNRTLGRGALKGLVGAVDPVTSGLGAVLTAAGVDAGKKLTDFDETISAKIDSAMPVHERDLGENPGFGEQFARFTNLESLVDSAMEFGLIGVGVGSTTKLIGSMAMRAGASAEAVTGSALVGKRIQGTVGEAGRLMSEPVRILGSKVTTNSVINGMSTNLLEGRVMADETMKELEQLYAPVLYNAEISQEVKDLVRKNISEAGNRVHLFNTGLAVVDIMGFSNFLKYDKKGIAKPGFWNYLWNNVKPMAPGEGIEELLQSVLQTDSEFQAIQDIEAETKGLIPKDLKGFEYKGTEEDQELMWRINPEKAKEMSLNEAKSNSEYLVDLATSHQAITETILGFVGGGPQWIITGAPTAFRNRKKNKEAFESQEKWLASVKKDYAGFIGQKILNETQLKEAMEEFTEKYKGTKKEYMAEALENYSINKIAIESLKNNREGALEDMLHETKKDLQKSLDDGSLSQEEFDTYTKRIEKTEGAINKFYNLKTYQGSSELLEHSLKEVALAEAIKSMETAKAAAEEQGAAFNAEIDSFMSGEDEDVEESLKELSPQAKELFDIADDDIKERTLSLLGKGVDLSIIEGALISSGEDTVEGEDILAKYANETGEVKTESEEVTIPETVSDGVYKNFKEKGKTSKRLLNIIAKKVVGNIALTPREEEVLTARESEVNEITDKLKPKKVEEVIEEEKSKDEEEVHEPAPSNVEVDYAESLRTMKRDLVQVREDIATLKSSAGQLQASKKAKEERKLNSLFAKISKTSDTRVLDSIDNSVKNKMESTVMTESELAAHKDLLNISGQRRAFIKAREDLTAEAAKTKAEKSHINSVIKKRSEDEPKGEVEDSGVAGSSSNAALTDAEREELNDQAMMSIMDAIGNKEIETIPGEVEKNIETNKEITAQIANRIADIDRELSQLAFSTEIKTPEGGTETVINPVSREDRIDAFHKAEALVAPMATLTADGRIPSYKTTLNMLQAAAREGGGELSEKAIEGLKVYYTVADGITESSVSERTPVQVDSDIHRKFVVHDKSEEVKAYEHTIASYLISGLAVAWEGEIVKDWNEVKKGTKVNFRVFSDEQMNELGAIVQVGTGIGDDAIRHLLWKDYLSGIADGSIDESKYPIEGMRTIEATLNSGQNKGAVIGKVHTTQWVRKERKEGLTDQDVDNVVADVMKLRNSIYAQTGRGPEFKKQAVSVVAGRTENIGTDIDKSVQIGTALRTDNIPKSSQLVFADDPNVIFTVLNHKADTLIPAKLAGELNRKGKEVIIPRFLRDNIAVESGAVLVLVPVENSNFMLAQKIVTTKLNKGEMGAITDIVTNLNSSTTYTKLKQALIKDKIVASPKWVEQMVQSMVYVGTLPDKPSTFNFKIEYEDWIDPKKYKNTKYKNKYPSIEDLTNSKVGTEMQLGSITFTVKLKSKEEVVKYKFMGRHIIGKSGKETNAYRYEVEETGVNQENDKRRKALRTLMVTGMNADTSSIPYHNLNNYALEHSQKDNPSPIKVLTIEEDQGEYVYNWKSTNYINDVVLKKTLTFLRAEPKQLPSGEFNYFTNTIVTVEVPQTDTPTQKKKKVSGKKIKKSNIESSTRATILAQIDDIGRIIAENELNLEDDIFFLQMVKDSRTTSGAYRLQNLKDNDTYTEQDIEDFLGYKANSSANYFQSFLEGNIRKTKTIIQRETGKLKILSANKVLKNYEEGSSYVSQRPSRGNRKARLQAKLKSKPKEVEPVIQKREDDFTDTEIEESNRDLDTEEVVPIKELIKDEFFNTREVIQKFKKKYPEGRKSDVNPTKGIDKISDAFNVTERRDIINSIKSAFLEQFLGTQTDEISPKKLFKIKKDTRIAVRGRIVDTIRNTKNYIQDLESNSQGGTSHHVLAEQYLQGLYLLRKGLSGDKLGGTTELRTEFGDLMETGFNNALRLMNYHVRNKLTQRIVEDEVGVDYQREDDNDEVDFSEVKNTFYDLRYSLFRNPKEKATARMKAKLATLERSSVTPNGNVFPVKGLIGGPVYEEDAYVILLDLLSGASEHSLKKKKSILRKLAIKAKTQPKFYSNMLWIADLVDALDGSMVSGDNFTDAEAQQFNMVMTNDKLAVKGLKLQLREDGRLIEDDFNYTSLMKETMLALNTNLNAVNDTEDSKEYMKKLLKPYRTANDSNLVLSKSHSRHSEEIDYLHANRDIIVKQSTRWLLNIFNSVEQYIPKTKSKLTQEDYRKLDEVRQVLAQESADRVTKLFVELNLPIKTNLYNVIYEGLLKGVTASEVDFDGAARTTEKPLITFVTGFVDTVEMYLKVNNDNYTSNYTKAFIAYLFKSQLMKVNSSIVRIGTKMVGTYNDPIHLYQMFKKVNDAEDRSYLHKLETDVYSKGSVIRNMLLEPSKYASQNMERVFSSPARSGLLSTWLSKIDKQDTPFVHALYGLAHYMQSVDLGYKDNVMGRVHNDFDYVIEQSGQRVKHRIGARIAKFTTPTHSDKDASFVGESLDFKASTVADNGAYLINEDYVKFYVDAIVTPEINRFIHTKSLAQNPQYMGQLIYSIPSMNTHTTLGLINSLDPNIEVHSLFAQNPYQNVKDNERYNKIRDIAVAAAKQQLVDNATKQFESYVEKGIITQQESNYVFNKKLRYSASFKAVSTNTESIPFNSLTDTSFVANTTETMFEKFLGNSRTDDEFIGVVDHLDNVILSGTRVIPEVLEEFFTPEGIEAISKWSEQAKDPKKNPAAIFGIALNTMGIKIPTGYSNEEDQFKWIEKLKYSASNNFDSKVAEENGYLKPKYLRIVNSASTGKIEADGELSSSEDYIVDLPKFMSLLINREFGQHFYATNYNQLIAGDMAQSYTKGDLNKNKGDQEEKFFGDPTYNYIDDLRATYNNNGKRLAKETSPARFSDGSKKYINVVIKDPTDTSKFYNGEDGFGNAEVMALMDGGSYTDADGRLEFLIAEGVLEAKDKERTKKYWNNELSEEALGVKLADKLAALVAKPRLVGTRKVTVREATANTPAITAQLHVYGKMGESILNKAKAGTDPNNYHVKMLGVIDQLKKDKPGMNVRLTPSSAIKIGQTDNTLDVEALVKDKDGRYDIPKDTYFDMSYEYYGRQQITSYKRNKLNKPSGQVENLVWNMIESGKRMTLVNTKREVDIRKYWENVLDELYEIHFERAEGLFLSKNAKNALAMLNADHGKEYDTLVRALIKEGLIGEAIKLSKAEGKNVNRKDVEVTAKEVEKAYENWLREDNSDETLAAILHASVEALADDDVTKSDVNIFEWLALEEDENSVKYKQFKYSLAASPYLKKFTDILRSTIEKNTVAVKRLGKQLPLESSKGYELSTMGLKNGKEGVVLFDTMFKNGKAIHNELEPQIPTKKGEKPRPAEILIPWDFVSVNNGRLNMEDFIIEVDRKGKKVPKGTKGSRKVMDTSRLPAEVLEAVGYRTPTQDYSMMSYVKVVGFLPPAFKNTIIAPKEFISIMGLDFDIDKLFMYSMYLFDEEARVNRASGKVTPRRIKVVDSKLAADGYKYEFLENEKVRIMQTILNDPDIIKNHISKPLKGEDSLKSIAEDLHSITSETNLLTGNVSHLSSAYQETKRNNAAGAATSIGVFAKLSRVSAMLHINPMKLYFRQKEGELKANTVNLGDAKFTAFGEKRNEIFEDSVGEARAYDERKNNISALISVSVDEEKLQMLYKLGIGENTYNMISNMLLLGFNAKTSLAIANMPMFDGSADKSKLISKVQAMYNTLPGKRRLKLEDIKSKHFSLLKGEKGTVNEDTLVDDLLTLNRKLRHAPNTMTLQDMINILSLTNFVDDINKSHAASLTPYNWVFNVDSKHFDREFPGIHRKWLNLTDPNNAPAVNSLKKIKEIELAIKSFNLFRTKTDRLIGDDSDITSVFNILTASGIETVDIFKVAQYTRSKKNQKYRPNYISLVDRLRVLRNSYDDVVVEYIRNNEFLSRIELKNDRISFRRDEKSTNTDIVNSLEELKQGGELAGVDLKILHRDLILYGITERKNSFGDNYLKAIKPEYYPTVDAENKMKYGELVKIAAYSAYMSLRNNVHSIPTFSNDALVWKVATKEGEVYIEYVDPDSPEGISTIKEDDAKSFYTIFEEDRIENEQLTTIGTVPLASDQKAQELDIKELTERAFSNRSMIPFKKLFRAVFREDGDTPTKIVLGSVEGGNPAVYKSQEGAIILKRDRLHKLKNHLIHEGTHKALQKVIWKYLTTKKDYMLEDYFKGVGPNGEVMAKELRKILDNMNAQRAKVVDDTVGLVDTFKTLYRGENEGKATPRMQGSQNAMDPVQIVTSVLNTDIGAVNPALLNSTLSPALKAYTTKNTVDRTESRLKNPDSNYKTKLAMLQAIMAGEGKGYTLMPSNVDGISSLYLYINGKKTFAYKMESDREKFYEIVRNEVKYLMEKNGDSQIQAMVKLVNRTDRYALDDYKKITDSFNAFIYGLTNLNEFAANAYAVGTGISPGLSETALDGYSQIGENGYQAIFNSPHVSFFAKIFNSVFKAIKTIIDKIIGINDSNTVWTDVMYATVLVDKATVLDTNTLDTKVQYNMVGEDILNNCR